MTVGATMRVNVADYHRMRDQLKRWRKECDRLRAERDAAVKLLEEAAAIDPDCPCQTCADERTELKPRIEAVLDAARHKHTDECWEPDSGCDMGRNPNYAARGEK